MKHLFMKRILVSFVTILFAITANAQWIDLGLPSGTKWKTHNEPGFFTFDEALANYKTSLPTYDQWGELYGMCDWVWLGTTYKVIGPNGNFIKLPASGARDVHGKVNSVGLAGGYWSSNAKNSQEAHCLGFGPNAILTFTSLYNVGLSVRLVE